MTQTHTHRRESDEFLIKRLILNICWFPPLVIVGSITWPHSPKTSADPPSFPPHRSAPLRADTQPYGGEQSIRSENNKRSHKQKHTQASRANKQLRVTWPIGPRSRDDFTDLLILWCFPACHSTSARDVITVTGVGRFSLSWHCSVTETPSVHF